MDMADDAQSVIELELNIALNRIKKSTKKSEEICLDCGEDIPPARQELGGVDKCVACQSIYENKRRMYGARN